MNEQYFTPRQVARAMDVSESSLKRWCDRGLIRSVRTAGGHRRLPLSGVLEFVRDRQCRLVRPDVLGLPSNTGGGPRVVDRVRDKLLHALLDEQPDACRQLLFDLHLAGRAVSTIADEVIAPVMEEIGRRWECGELEVFRERRACQLILRALFELHAALPEPTPDAPRAIGGTLEGDPYQVSTTLAEMVMRQLGWRATSLGSSLPVDTLVSAISRFQPRLFWLSASHIDRPEQFLAEWERLYQSATQRGAAVVVGGGALTDALRRRMRFSAHGDHMRHLQEFARTLFAPDRTSVPAG